MCNKFTSSLDNWCHCNYIQMNDRIANILQGNAIKSIVTPQSMLESTLKKNFNIHFFFPRINNTITITITIH